jgi:hypothetical protein
MNNREKILLISVLLLFAGLVFTINVPLSESVSFGETLLENFKKEYEPPEPLLPPGIQIKAGFEPGIGAAVGGAQMVQGDVYVIHKDQPSAYRLDKDNPLFAEDTLVTSERSRLSESLNDKSVFSLAANSKLVLDQSVYDPVKDERSSVLSLLFGKARFIVTKISQREDYKVKTPTSVCGVRGSDFGIAVAPDVEKTTALQSLLSYVTPVREARAAVAGALLTTVVTGEATTVSFVGTVGGAQIVGPFAICAASAGAAAIAPIAVGAIAAGGALGAAGPGLASMSMPPGF